MGLFKVNDARQELIEKCFWNEKQSHLNDEKSFLMLSVQTGKCLHGDVPAQLWEIRNCMQEGVAATQNS